MIQNRSPHPLSVIGDEGDVITDIGASHDIIRVPQPSLVRDGDIAGIPAMRIGSLRDKDIDRVARRILEHDGISIVSYIVCETLRRFRHLPAARQALERIAHPDTSKGAGAKRENGRIVGIRRLVRGALLSCHYCTSPPVDATTVRISNNGPIGMCDSCSLNWDRSGGL